MMIEGKMRGMEGKRSKGERQRGPGTGEICE